MIDFDTGVFVLVQSGTNNTLDGVFYFDRDDEIYVVVTVNDGIVDSTPYASSMVSVSNLAPVIDHLTITPNGATAGEDDLICEVIATDVDGDNVEYISMVRSRWSGSTKHRSHCRNFDVYLGSGTTTGDWTCLVTPTDSFENGLSESTSIYVQTSVETSLSRVHWTENGSSRVRRSQPDGSELKP